MICRIKNGKVIKSGKITDDNVYFENGIITKITGENLPFDKEIDAGGNYVSPGFIDMHTHGGGGYDFMDAAKDAVVKACDFHFSHGTTTIFPTTLAADKKSTMRALEAVKEAMNSGSAKGRIAGVHMEGPYFSLKQSGAQNPENITPPIPDDYNEMIEKYGDVIKRWSFAPELSGSEEFVKTLHKNKIISSIAHTDATYDDVMKVYNLGCKLITHFFSCISSITRKSGFRILGVMETGYLLDDMNIEIIADGCHVPPELLKMVYKIKGEDNISLVTDSMLCAGTGEKEAKLGGLPCIIEDGVAKLKDRSAFAGSIATCDRLVRVCVKDAGISIPSAVKMMTENPAKVMGLENLGKIEEGYFADFVIFDNDVNIVKVISKGEER